MRGNRKKVPAHLLKYYIIQNSTTMTTTELKTDLQNQIEFKPKNTLKEIKSFTVSYEVQTEKPYKKSTPYQIASISIYDSKGAFVSCAIWSSLGKQTIEDVIERKLTELKLI